MPLSTLMSVSLSIIQTSLNGYLHIIYMDICVEVNVVFTQKLKHNLMNGFTNNGNNTLCEPAAAPHLSPCRLTLPARRRTDSRSHLQSQTARRIRPYRCRQTDYAIMDSVLIFFKKVTPNTFSWIFPPRQHLTTLTEQSFPGNFLLWCITSGWRESPPFSLASKTFFSVSRHAPLWRGKACKVKHLTCRWRTKEENKKVTINPVRITFKWCMARILIV